MQSLNRFDSLGGDVLSAANTEHILDTYRRLIAAGYGESSEEFRPDLAPDLNGPEYFGSEFYGGEELGGLFSSIAKGISSIGKGIASGVKAVGTLPGVSTAFAPVRLVSDIAQGRNVVSSVRKQAESVVRDTRASLPVAASVVSVVPGVGTGVAAGLSAASALSQGKSLREIAEDAAMGAIPGGQLARSALRVGINAARGENVLQSAVREGVSYAKSQIPGGQAVQTAATAALNVARGQNVISAVTPMAQQLVRSPMVKVLPSGAALQFPRGISPKAITATTNQVLRAAQSRNPAVVSNVRQILANTQRAAQQGNPGAALASRTIRSAANRRFAQLMRR